MTDGDNNDPQSDIDTTALCDAAKLDQITVFTVAFMAPKKGEDLLKACASDEKMAFDASKAKALTKHFARSAKKSANQLFASNHRRGWVKFAHQVHRLQ